MASHSCKVINNFSKETLHQLDTIKSIIEDNHSNLIKEKKDIVFKKKHFIKLNHPNYESHLFHFRYTIKKHKLDFNIFIKPIEDDFINYNLVLQFNTIVSNYYLHLGFIKFFHSLFNLPPSQNLHNFVINKELFIFKTILIKEKDEKDVFTWEDILNCLNDYILGFDNRCFISHTTNSPLFEPNPEFNSALVINEKYIDEYNTLFIQKDKLSCFIENNTDVIQLISIMMKTVFLSTRYDIIFDEPKFFKEQGSSVVKEEIISFLKEWDSIQNYISVNKFNEYKFYLKFPNVYRTILYFINKINKYTFKKCDIGEKFEKEDCIVLELTSTQYDDEIEELNFETHKNDYAFHGSVPENWYSIINNGLKPGNVKKGTLINANVYGAGIYLSDSPHYSINYSKSSNSKKVSMEHSNYYIMGVYQVLKPLDTYKKAPKIFVVPEPKEVKLKYLFVMKTTFNRLKIIDMISKQFSNVKLKQTAQDMLVLSSRINNTRLKKEYNNIISPENIKKREEDGFFIEPVFNPDTMNIWKFKFKKENLPTETTLFKQLVSKNIDDIIFEIRFKERYPFEAPFVRIIEPRFKFRTGHITIGGSICSQLLSPSGWTPVTQTDQLLINIKQLLIDGNAELDTEQYNKKYELKEAEIAFQRMIKTHNW
jgi:ubiquitin-protein ligase